MQKKHKMSPAGRQRIADAQRARWATAKAAAMAHSTANTNDATMSAMAIMDDQIMVLPHVNINIHNCDVKLFVTKPPDAPA